MRDPVYLTAAEVPPTPFNSGSYSSGPYSPNPFTPDKFTPAATSLPESTATLNAPTLNASVDLPQLVFSQPNFPQPHSPQPHSPQPAVTRRHFSLAHSLAAVLGSLLVPSALMAQVPNVSVDIAPLHSLVAQVMGDLGDPDLILEPGASPHGYALRPSQARALSQSDLVFWIGEALEPWLAGPLEKIATKATQIEMLEATGTKLLSSRTEAVFSHSPEVDSPDQAEIVDQSHKDDDHGGHDHKGIDPHAWLDPRNAIGWLDNIASALAQADPENAERYRANAAQATAQLQQLDASFAAQLLPVQNRGYVTFHDGYHYFENRYGLQASGAVTLSDASHPSPARIAALSAVIQTQPVICAFLEPQFNQALLTTAFGEVPYRVEILDPLGSTLEPGPALYRQLLQNLADSFLRCLAP